MWPSTAEYPRAACTRCGGLLSGDSFRPQPERRLMNKKEPATDRRQEPEARPRRVRLPGFLIEEETGLGDAIKRVTYAMGIEPCAGCEKRAAALNRWVRFT